MHSRQWITSRVSLAGVLVCLTACVVFAQAIPALTIPQVANLPGWSSDVTLENASSSAVRGTLRFYGGAGEKGKAIRYDLVPGGRKLVKGTEFGVPNETGFVRIWPDRGSGTPAASVTVVREENGHATARLRIPAQTAARSFRLTAEALGTAHHVPGAVRTALAISNISAQPATIKVEFTSSLGASLVIPAGTHYSGFLDDLPGMASKLHIPFQGILRISSNVDVTLIAIRGSWNAKAEFEAVLVAVQK